MEMAVLAAAASALDSIRTDHAHHSRRQDTVLAKASAAASILKLANSVAAAVSEQARGSIRNQDLARAKAGFRRPAADSVLLRYRRRLRRKRNTEVDLRNRKTGLDLAAIPIYRVLLEVSACDLHVEDK